MTGGEYALKRISKLHNIVEDIDKEITCMLSVDHPHCVKLYEVFETSKEVVLVMELLHGGELFERILTKNKVKNKYKEYEAATIFRKVLGAVRYLHQTLGIIHRDIKPENILLTSENDDLDVKLADFNLSKQMGESNTTHTVLGTMGYCAPEVISNKPYSFSADYWSLGVCLYILLAGFPPFPLGKDPMSPIKTKSGKFNFPEKHWGHISNEAKDVIRKLLVVDPKARIAPDELDRHPWLLKHAPPPEEEPLKISKSSRTASCPLPLGSPTAMPLNASQSGSFPASGQPTGTTPTSSAGMMNVAEADLIEYMVANVDAMSVNEPAQDPAQDLEAA